MIRWLFSVFIGCNHKYVIIQKINYYNEYSDYPTKFGYHMQCEHCGNLKFKVSKGE